MASNSRLRTLQHTAGSPDSWNDSTSCNSPSADLDSTYTTGSSSESESDYEVQRHLVQARNRRRRRAAERTSPSSNASTILQPSAKRVRTAVKSDFASAKLEPVTLAAATPTSALVSARTPVGQPNEDRSRQQQQQQVRRVKPEKKRANPPRPLNAFMVWSSEKRNEMQAKDSKLHNAHISQHLGKEWRGMSDKEKKPFYDRAEQLKQAHLEKYPGYKYQPRKKTGKSAKGLAAAAAAPSATAARAPTSTTRRKPESVAKPRKSMARIHTAATAICSAVSLKPITLVFGKESSPGPNLKVNVRTPDSDAGSVLPCKAGPSDSVRSDYVGTPPRTPQQAKGIASPFGHADGENDSELYSSSSSSDSSSDSSGSETSDSETSSSGSESKETCDEIEDSGSESEVIADPLALAFRDNRQQAIEEGWPSLYVKKQYMVNQMFDDWHQRLIMPSLNHPALLL